MILLFRACATPIAIVIGFSLIAAALYVRGLSSSVAEASPSRGESAYFYGDKRAGTTIVEFSDIECPFCARVHPTIKQLVDESNGMIRWEYRHLPLSIHSNAYNGAIAVECVGKLTKGEQFWPYLDVLFANQRSHSDSFYREAAINLGVDGEKYDTCIIDPTMAARVDADLAAAQQYGANGTPHSIILYPDGTSKPVSGALPYEQWTPLFQ